MLVIPIVQSLYRESLRGRQPGRANLDGQTRYRFSPFFSVFFLSLALIAFNSYKDIIATNPDDFVILGFPCNQFASQDPGSNDEIQEFCQVNYGVTFPILGKVDVNGDKPEPVWDWLKNEQAGVLGIKRVKWNFEKFLIGRDGKVKGRWASTTKPEALESKIKEQRE